MKTESRRGRWVRGVGVAAVVAAVLFTTSSLSGAQGSVKAAEPVYGGTLVIAKDQEAVGFDPHKVPALSSIQVYSLMYSQLVDMNAEGNIIPELATSWENPDPTTYVFHLREGVTFHSGRALTAEDVKYSFERILDPDTASIATSYFNMVERIETPDPYTVIFELEQPFAPFLSNLSSSWAAIVDRGVVEEHGDLQNADGGSGPFRLTEWIPGDHTTLVKHEAYWDEGKPYVDAIRFNILTDEAARVAAMRTGRADLSAISSLAVPLLKPEPNVEIVSYQSLDYTYLGFNTSREPFDDPRVRLAISYAVDRELLAQVVYSGQARVTGPISPANTAWALPVEEFDSYEYNPEKARELLAEAGYSDGFETTIKTAGTYQYMQDTALVIQEQFREVGIDAELQLVEWSRYIDVWSNADHDMLVGLNGSGTTPDRALYFFFHSGASANVWGFENAAYDALVEEARRTVDEEKAHALYAKAQRMLVNELAPNLFLNSPERFYAVGPHVRGYEPSALIGQNALVSTWLADADE